MTSAIEFHDVDILFSREQGRSGAKALREALSKLDQGLERAARAEGGLPGLLARRRDQVDHRRQSQQIAEQWRPSPRPMRHSFSTPTYLKSHSSNPS